MSSPESLLLTRFLDGGKIIVRTECQPGVVTVLQDANGTDLPAYEALFCRSPNTGRFTIEKNQKPIDLTQVPLIGFSDNIPASIYIKEYLSNANYSDQEIDAILKEYELDKVQYLPCAHLPIIPQRMITLLAALKTEHAVIVLKDPFMPFSGRWREHFASLLEQQAQVKHQVIICTNLSFVPQIWSQGNKMHYLDVGQAAEEARARYRWEQLKKQKEQEKAAKETVLTPEVSNINIVPAAIQNTAIQNKPEADQNSELLNFAYREIQDRIFTPLKEISDFLRSYSVFVALGCITVLIASMGVVFAPNLGELQEKMALLSRDTNWSITSIWNPKPSPVDIKPKLPTYYSDPRLKALRENVTFTLEDSLKNPEIEVNPIEITADEIDLSLTPIVFYSLVNGDLNAISCK
jgi:hypothetical protein